MKRVLAILLLGFPLAGSAFADSIRVATSVPPIGALARMVGGDRVEVQVLMPPGASPHGYEPGPDAIRALSNAEIVFVVGRNLDGWAENLARGANPKIRIERIGTGLDTAEPPSAPEDPEGDPHVWLDPLKASAMAGRIGETLAALRPADADSIDARARRAMQQIAALDLYCQKALDPVHEIPFVALHGGLNHLVARYQLAQIAIIEIFPDHEPSPRYLKQVISSIRNTNARAVIAEPQLSAQLAEVVAGEAHVPVVEIDAIGGVPGNMTYEELIHTVVDALVRALGEKQ